LLAAPQRQLAEIAAATRRAKNPLSGRAKIGLRVGRALNRHKVGKHFELTIDDTRFAFRRNEARIAAEAQLDRIYVVRTSVKPQALKSADAVRAYKDLSTVERAFRCLKTVDLKMRKKLALLLFDDHELRRGRDDAGFDRATRSSLRRGSGQRQDQAD
jgi:hypothetical protein